MLLWKDKEKAMAKKSMANPHSPPHSCTRRSKVPLPPLCHVFVLIGNPFSDWFFERGRGPGHSVQRDIQRHNRPRGLRREPPMRGQGISRADRDVAERGRRSHRAERQRGRWKNGSGWAVSEHPYFYLVFYVLLSPRNSTLCVEAER